jgi:predicted nuclease with TOPRIM domain
MSKISQIKFDFEIPTNKNSYLNSDSIKEKLEKLYSEINEIKEEYNETEKESSLNKLKNLLKKINYLDKKNTLSEEGILYKIK